MKELANLSYPSTHFSTNSITIDNGLSYDKWLELGGFLTSVKKTVQFWIGDYLTYGEKAYGERYRDALKTFSLSFGTLRNMKYIASKVQMSFRNDNLTFSHHQMVASLKPEDQKEYLDRAVLEEWNIHQLREAVFLKFKAHLHRKVAKTSLAALPEPLKDHKNGNGNGNGHGKVFRLSCPDCGFAFGYDGVKIVIEK